MQAKQRSCWIATDGAIGNEKQCLALAHYLGVAAEVFRIRLRHPWEELAPRLVWRADSALDGELRARLDGDLPALMITCGRRSTLASLAVKARSAGRTRTVHVLNPRLNPARFDRVVCPRHDRLSGPNVIATRGALHLVDEATLAEAREVWRARLEPLAPPRIAVLIGASNRAYRIDRDYLEAIQLAAERLAGRGSLMVTTSRRTPPELRAFIAARFSPPEALAWTGEEDGDNPYLGYLAWADRIVVSADSVNMVSEALGTGKPVHCTPPGRGSVKFRRFHRSLSEAGMVLPLRSDAPASYPPLRETRAVAERIAGDLGQGVA